ncbi:MAG: hypothetical protein FD156_2333 [Nitrospirae bacterium]|nr:MAG: hypothetical protein FD156_2333 [Nitrospirota bacterium]
MASNIKGRSIKMRNGFISLLFLVFSIILPLNSFAAGAADGVENPKACKQCGMDRAVFARSRMLIVYADGATVGVCSLHCAAAEMKQNKNKQIKSLMVADYTTLTLIDAKTATWVVGGKKEGVMTSLAKWAFAREEDAQKFVQENGGKVTPFDQATEAAGAEVGESTEMKHEQQSHMSHNMKHMDMGPGAQMVFNPAFGDQIYHTHPAGMWMVNYQYMHMKMSGLRAGNKDVDQNTVSYKRGKPYNYMMIPTTMSMDMQMLMVMYGFTDQLTGMVMGNHQENEMAMLMDMGPGKKITREDPMRTQGFGDVELRGIYKVNKYLVGSLGLSLPTGDIDQKVEMMHKEYRAPYDMQLGSGTYDLKPALTYNGLSNDAKWNWGAQTMYTYRMDDNKNGYRLGNVFKVNSWFQRALGPASSWLRLAYSDTGRIRGHDPEIDKLIHPVTGMGAPTPDADPDNYGGRRLDGALGVSYQKGPFSVGVEGGVPMYQNLNGLQLKTVWFINAGIQVMF